MKKFITRVTTNNMSIGDAGILALLIVILIVSAGYLLHTMGVKIDVR